MDEEAIIDFAFNSFKSFVYSSLYFMIFYAENFVKIWLFAAAEGGDIFQRDARNTLRPIYGWICIALYLEWEAVEAGVLWDVT